MRLPCDELARWPGCFSSFYAATTGNRWVIPMSQITINQQLTEEKLIMHVFKI